MKTLVIYHGNCADGFTAAWAVRHALGDENCEFFPGVYGEEPPNVIGRDVIMVDFSYKRNTMDSILSEAKKVLVLDHHVSAQKELEGLDGIRKGVEVYFDMTKSGAMLAWEWFHPHELPPRLIDYVQDRDLWQFKLPYSREFAAYVFSFEYYFNEWDRIVANADDEVAFLRQVSEGAAILRKQQKDIVELLQVTTRWTTIRGHQVPVANLPYTLCSEAGHELCRMHKPAFAATYFDRKDMRVFSLRSLDDGLDVSLIARSYGGGGHKHAAGFQMPHDWLGDERKETL